MSDKDVFDPEKITCIDIKMIEDRVNAPEPFDVGKVTGHQLDNALRLGFVLEDKLAKANFTIELSTASEGANRYEATGHFHLQFIYHIENLDKLATPGGENRLIIHPDLTNALASVTYSTTRGMLYTRLLGTALQKFILPIIHPGSLFRQDE